MLKHIKFRKFTAFEKLDIELSPGINIFVGENGTGKTHLLKAAYAACAITKGNGGFAEKLNNVFYPSGRSIGRLVKRTHGRSSGSVEVVRKANSGRKLSLQLSLSTNMSSPSDATVSGSPKAWMNAPVEVAYIPVKDMMANAPGFSSLYEQREIHFEEVYVDIVRKASLPFLRGRPEAPRRKLLALLEEAMDGKVLPPGENGEFFLRSSQGELEFTLLAEGYRKLGLLWILIQNGTLLNGSVLFWDEPEANLNPKLMQAIVGILLELQRMGVQMLLTTHDYLTLKEFDLQTTKKDQVVYHSLYRKEDTKDIEISSTDDYLSISPNAIDDTFGSIIHREIGKSMGDLGK